MRMSFLGRLSLLLACALCLLPATSYGQNTAPWTERDGLVVIRTANNPLQPEDEARLEALLQTRLDSTGARLVIVLIDGIQDDINLYAVELAQSWGIGSADEDNGAILLVDLENRKMALQVGYGLEDELPDITCSQIIENELVPSFKAGDIAGGLEAGAEAVFAATQGQYRAQKRNEKELPWFAVGLFVLFFAFTAYRSRNGHGPTYGSDGRRGGGPFFFPMGGGFGGGSSGGGGFGGGGAFGGGGFGGGGSSGSW